MKRTGFFILSLWLLVGCLRAQPTDTLQLDWIEVKAERPADFTGYRVLRPDSQLLQLMPAASLSDLLERQGALSLRTYGMGSLSTAGSRGSGSAHTAVLWDGFSLHSPMNGLHDLSLLPLFFIDNSQLQLGASVAMFGSGAVGASIQLGQSMPARNRLALFYEGGSFAQHSAGFQLGFNYKRVSQEIRWFTKSAQNDFPYQNIARFGAPTEQLQNAALRGHGLLYQLGWRISRYDSLTFKFWWQDFHRQLPPPMTAVNAAAVQDDQQNRLQWRWQHQRNRHLFGIRQLLTRELNAFTDPWANLDEKHRFDGLITEAGWDFQPNQRHKLALAVQHSHYAASSPAFQQAVLRQDRLAAWLSWQYTLKRWQTQLSIRQERFRQAWVPLTPALGLRYRTHAQGEWYANASRSFRLPTLNDLYWVPGGNPQLQPELGWSAESGYQWRFDYKQQLRSLNLSVFQQDIRQWIIWLPSAAGYWVPENLLRVQARGLEIQGRWSWQIGRHQVRFLGDYAWLQSIHKEVGPGQENRLNKQLIYLPRHQLRAQLWYAYRDFSVAWLQNFTGIRYVNADHSAALDPYALSQLMLNYQWSFPRIALRTGIQIQNLLDHAYQTVQWRPMPGRYYLFNLTLIPRI